MTQGQLQIGKNGITENFIGTLSNHFKKHNNMKINVLKSARQNRETVKKYSEEILSKFGDHYTAKVVGFSIFVKKWRRVVR